MIDLSIVVPSIRSEQDILNLYDSITKSCVHHTFELIVVGPHCLNLPQTNIKIVKDYGNISRCVQLGAYLSEGIFFTWTSDDCLYEPNTLDNCINLLSNQNSNNGLIIRYFEAVNRHGVPNDDSYWVARTHDAQKLPGVLGNYPSAPVGMYYTEFFRNIGGLDCSFQHCNMNAIDLGYRVINGGGQIHLSPDNPVMIADFDNQTNPDHKILDYMYAVNDKPKFESLYSVEQLHRTNIDFDNWRAANKIWERFHA